MSAQSSFNRRKRRSAAGTIAALFIVLAVFGYKVSRSHAEVVGDPYSPSVNDIACNSTTGACTQYDVDGVTCLSYACTGDVACEPPGVAADAAKTLTDSFTQDMYNSAADLENQLWQRVTDFLKSEFIQVEWIERSMIDWWQTMWYYNLLPGLQGMARQLNIDLATQTFDLQNQADATLALDTNLALRKHEIEDAEIRPGEQICVAGTLGGGFTRSNSFARAMRQAWEYQSTGTALNTKGTYGSVSAAATRGKLYHDYRAIFCDPKGNGGANACITNQINPDLTNADIESNKFLFNKMTIPVDDMTPVPAGSTTKGAQASNAIEDLIINMVGLPNADTMLTQTIASPQGQEKFMDRRSYVARHEAIRSVPHMIAGWRMPGSGMGPWLKDLRQNAGIDLPEIGSNPSYKEIMHAMSVDRFNSGRYAANMITTDTKIEMEKLNLSVFYLMQLRDYYELLERTALTLAVQVTLLANEQSLPVGAASMGTASGP